MSDVDPNLRAVLGDHAGGVRVVANVAERAIERDRSNRRRELGAGALAAALVIVVAVPVGWAAMRPSGSRALPAGPTSSSSASTSSSTSVETAHPTGDATPRPPGASSPPTPTTIPTLRPTGAGSAVRLSPSDGPATGATSAGYVVDGIFHAGTSSITLPDDLRDTGFVARLGDGLLVSGPEGYVVVGPDGRKGAVIASSQSSPRISGDRTHALLADADGALVYADSAGRRVASLPVRSSADSGYRPAGLVGTTAYAARPDTGSSVAWDVVSGKVTPLQGEFSDVSAATGKALSYDSRSVSASGSDSCNALVDLASGRAVWRMCGPLRFLGFSDDGTYLLATGHVDGFAPWRFPSLVVIRASDGAIVLQGGGLEAGTGDIVGVRLGTDRRVTLQVSAGDQRSLQSCGLDGSCEVVGPARPPAQPAGPGAPGPYVLSAS